jgi:hypothetical protein
VTIIQPHDIAVLATPNIVYLMKARELFAQLGQGAHWIAFSACN